MPLKMRSIVISLYYLLCFFLVFCCGGIRIEAASSVWWKTTIIYQIFIPSFKDANNDGIGDFKGATQNLAYLKDIGVGTVWLSSFHKAATPFLDFAVMDFKSIHHQYGTLADFEDFMAECSKLGLNVIMDFVPNHSSTGHEWFKKSVKKETAYTDYYIWKASSSNNKSFPLPPCNWANAEGDENAWTWNKEREEYYYHAYSDDTADLNLRNTNVQKEIKDILQFWMSLGVKGFVIQTFSYLYEDEKCVDEPVTEKPNENKHPYTMNQQENLQQLKEWRKFIDDFPSADSKPRFLMVQADPFVGEIKQDYYGSGKEQGAHIVMNPTLMINEETIYSHELDQSIGKALKQMVLKKPALWINWAVGGSRITRVASRLGKQLVDGFNMLSLMLPGTPITYYGEEIGMESLTKIVPELTSRDYFAEDRTPFQWNDHPNAGFTESHSTDLWLPVNSNYFRINVEKEKENPKSHLNNYKRVAKLRSQPEMLTSEITTFFLSANVFILVRETDDDKKYIVLINLGDNSPCINFRQNILDIKDPFLVVHTASENSEYNLNDKVNIENCFLMRPKSSLLLTTSAGSILRRTLAVMFLPLYAIFLLS